MKIVEFNILFLVIDSLRNDEFEKFCKRFPNSNLNKLASSGLYFSQTISSADATLLSLSSILTGLFPCKTGIRSEKLNKLKPDVKTLFNLLKSEGYHLYGYNPTVVNMVNLLPIFENKDSSSESSPRLTGDIGEKIIKNIEKFKKPWISFVHTTDLHDPITIPKKFDSKEYGLNQYEKQIFAIDNEIGKLLETINLEKTFFILTADHGTYLKQMTIDSKDMNFEDNPKNEILQKKIGKKIPKFLNPLKDKIFYSQVEHKRKSKLNKIKDLELSPYEKRNLISEKFNVKHYLFDELIKVPLIIVGNKIPQKIINQQIRTVDIFPTLLDLLEIKFNKETIDGKSLQIFFNTNKHEENFAYFESNPLIQLESEDVIGIRTSKYKYFRDSNNPKKRVHLYDISKDPYENKNISDENLEIINKFEDILQKITKNSKIEINDELNDDEIYDELKKLGYA